MAKHWTEAMIVAALGDSFTKVPGGEFRVYAARQMPRKRYRADNGNYLPVPDGERVKYKWTPEKEAELTRLYQDGMRRDEICRVMGLRVKQLKSRLQLLGVYRK
jgi:hypothetical protein